MYYAECRLPSQHLVGTKSPDQTLDQTAPPIATDNSPFPLRPANAPAPPEASSIWCRSARCSIKLRYRVSPDPQGGEAYYAGDKEISVLEEDSLSLLFG